MVLKERLGAIMKFRKKSKAIIAITAIFTAAVCVCFFVTGAYATPSPYPSSLASALYSATSEK